MILGEFPSGAPPLSTISRWLHEARTLLRSPSIDNNIISAHWYAGAAYGASLITNDDGGATMAGEIAGRAEQLLRARLGSSLVAARRR